jgi:hypothetical protein
MRVSRPSACPPPLPVSLPAPLPVSLPAPLPIRQPRRACRPARSVHSHTVPSGGAFSVIRYSSTASSMQLLPEP